VGAVVFDEMELRPRVAYAGGRESLTGFSDLDAVPRTGCVASPGRRAYRGAHELGAEVGSWIAGDSDVVWLGSPQARLCRLDWKTRPMLDAIETFLLEGGAQMPLVEHGGRRIAVECV
jgi:hypothetical protein